MIKTIQAKVIEIRKETPNTKTFRLDLKGETFDFKPGQFVMAKVNMRETEKFKVLHNKSKTQQRAYSISSAPYETNFIEITVKEIEEGFVSKYFNQVIEVGDEFEIKGPMGHFTIDKHEKNIVLIGAGCGIAPFRSIMLDICEKKLPINITLVDSNRTPEDILYYKEFLDLCKNNENMTCYFTITRPWLMKNTTWDGPTGRLNEASIKNNVKDYQNVVYYICGPAQLISDMEKILQELGVPKEKIKSERYGC